MAETAPIDFCLYKVSVLPGVRRTCGKLFTSTEDFDAHFRSRHQIVRGLEPSIPGYKVLDVPIGSTIVYGNDPDCRRCSQRDANEGYLRVTNLNGNAEYFTDRDPVALERAAQRYAESVITITAPPQSSDYTHVPHQSDGSCSCCIM